MSPDLVLTAVKVEKELPLPLVFIFSIKIYYLFLSERGKFDVSAAIPGYCEGVRFICLSDVNKRIL